MVKFNISFDERIPAVLNVITRRVNNPVSEGELAECFEDYLKGVYEDNDLETAQSVYDSIMLEDIVDDFSDFIFDYFGLTDFPECYLVNYGFHYDENSVSFKFDLMD